MVYVHQVVQPMPPVCDMVYVHQVVQPMPPVYMVYVQQVTDLKFPGGNVTIAALPKLATGLCVLETK